MKNISISLLYRAMGLVILGAVPVFGQSTVVSGFEAPESAIHDTAADVYLVSNIGPLNWSAGGPAAFDGNGSISRVLPNGSVQHKWIAHGVNGVTLHAPKGMGISGNVLYVADIDTIRLFHRTTGAPLGNIAVPNPFPSPLFLNDVTVTSNGTVFITESDHGAIFKINPAGKEATVHSVAAALNYPNGIVADGPNGAIWVTWFAPGQILSMGANRKISVVATISGMDYLFLDGLVRKSDGSFLTSSWVTGSIYHVSASGTVLGIAAQFTGGFAEGPADLGLDQGRNRLLVPLLLVDQLVLVNL